MIGIDFETYGTRDLKTVGLDNYVSDPDFRILLAVTVSPMGTYVFDFVGNPYEQELERFYHYLHNNRGETFVAHNAPFEMSVLKRLGPHFSNLSLDFRDSAVIARLCGADSALENAAPQLLDSGDEKLSTGRALLKKFSMGPTPPTKQDTYSQDWADFIQYCQRDADLARKLETYWGGNLPSREYRWFYLTHEMNQVGWPVDRESVQKMYVLSEENKARALFEFQKKYDPEGLLNLGSHPQQKAWCAARGVRATSFDERSVVRLIHQLTKKLGTTTLTEQQRENYTAVLTMLTTKQILGGSSLKKLPVLLATTSADRRLRNSYMHVGAGQTGRTTGRGAQLQNLPRITSQIDMSRLGIDPIPNDVLAANIRQLLTASEPAGSLIVGDFASIESRCLAYLAGETWKLRAYHNGQDLYKVQASAFYNVPVEDITKAQRQSGKVGELGCGYGAGAGAIASFAETIGVLITPNEAQEIVTKWRAANPSILSLWQRLDNAFTAAVVNSHATSVQLNNGFEVYFVPAATPRSLRKQDSRANSFWMAVYHESRIKFRRIFHGCYSAGRNIQFYKPSSTNGQLWSPTYTDPKTRQTRYHSLYGGKLAGILVQSTCREIFFESLSTLHGRISTLPELEIIGQFHDEIILDYKPSELDPLLSSKGRLSSVDEAVDFVERTMSIPPYPNFPMKAEVKHDYRYTK